MIGITRFWCYLVLLLECRVLVVFLDGLIALWDIRESKSIFTAGVNTLQSLQHETRKVTSACWACPSGTKVVVGYNNGEIFIWSIPMNQNPSECSTQSSPICKLNLGYKLDKIPIASLRWVYAEGKASRIYVMGASDIVSSNLLQVLQHYHYEMCHCYNWMKLWNFDFDEAGNPVERAYWRPHY